MTSGHRWSLVAVSMVLVVATPLVLRARHVADSSISASALLVKVRASADTPYSGYVESLGTLDLPVTNRFTDLGELFGGRTRLRVWWRGAQDWRVDQVLPTGETDLIHHDGATTTWEYEASRATSSVDPVVRLPRSSDLLPPILALLLLDGATDAEVSRLPAEQIAGRSAPGLRLTPEAPESSISNVDVWADPGTGLPVRVSVYADGLHQAALTASFMELSTETPSRSRTAFAVPRGADARYDDVTDIADAANRFAPLSPPRTLGGLDLANEKDLRAVGVYGSGVTRMIAIPLWDRTAEPLRDQLRATPGTKTVPGGDLLLVGPLRLLLTKYDDGGGWLVAGTVTESTLRRAADEIQARVVTQ